MSSAPTNHPDRAFIDNDGALDRPTGSMRRFVLVAMALIVALSSVIFGVAWWMQATAKPDYTGPAPLAYPEKRPYR